MTSTIGRKIAFAFFILLVLMAVMVGVTVQGLNRVTSSLDGLETEAVKRGAAGNLRFAVTQVLMASNDYIITEKDGYRREFERLVSLVDQLHQQFQSLAPTDEEKQFLALIKQDIDSIRAYSAQIFAFRHPRQSPTAWALMETMDYRFGAHLNSMTTSIFEGTSTRIEQQRFDAASSRENATFTVYAILGLAVLFGLFVTYLAVERIAKPIVTVTRAANGLANGDYSQRPTVRSHDEVKVLAETFCRMADEIQRSQHALLQSMQLTEAVVSTVPSGLLVFGSDGKVLSVNNSFLNLFGIANPPFPEVRVMTTFEELGVSEECRRLILERKLLRDKECEYSDAIRGERNLNISVVPMRVSNGETLLIVDDITHRKQAEQVARESEQRFRALIENSSDGLYIISADGSLLYESPNAPSIVGYSPGELKDTNVFSIVHPDDYPSMMSQFNQVLAKPSATTTAELRVRHKDGTWRWVETTAANHLNEPTICGIVVNFRDVTERKLAEETARRSEALLARAQHIAKLGSWDWNIVTNELCWSDEIYRIFGLRPKEFGATYEAFLNTVHPDDRSIVMESVDRALHQGTPYSIDHRILLPDGSEKVVHEQALVSHDDSGKSVRMAGTVQDVTEQKRAEEVLRQSEEKYRTLVESTTDLIQVVSPDGRLLFANRAWRETLGFTETETIDLPIDRLVHPEDLTQCYAVLQSALSGRRVGRIETRFVNKLGESIVVEGNIACQFAGSTPMAITCFFRDVTDRKVAEEENRRAQESLRKSQQKYKNFFEEDLTGDFITAPDGRILACNPAFVRMFGFATREEALQSSALSLWLNPADREKMMGRLNEEKKLEYIEIPMIRRDGKPLHVVANVIGRFNEDGNLTHLQGYLFDDTKRRRLESQLLQAQKIEGLGTLAGGIAHDFNNILGIILANAHLLRNSRTDSKNFGQGIDAIEKVTQRGALLVAQLLTFARKKEVHVESVQPNDIVLEVKGLLLETFPKNILVGTELQADLPSIHADATQIHQIVLNLCVNARDAMPSGGTLSITTKTIQGETVRLRHPRAELREYVEVQIRDSGIGMDEETRLKIFEPFFTTKGVGKGTGLGLSLVYGIVENHKGFIDVFSKVGKGTEFHVYLPVQEVTIMPMGRSAPAKEDAPGGSETILLIEDEDLLREFMRVYLASKGYTVHTAEDGMHGVELYRTHQSEIAVVLSDMGLPLLGGREVCKTIRELNPQAKLIMASGYVDPQTKSEMYKAGARDFIQKPYTPAEVLRKIREVLDR